MRGRPAGHDPDAPARAREALLAAHRRGEPADIEAHWAAAGPGATVEDLAALVKLDMQCRADRGQRPQVRDYTGRFPALLSHKDRMVSLIYEEFCLTEERGEAARPSEFYERYAAWADSLAWQLDCHRNISRFAPSGAPAPRFPEVDERFGGFRLRKVLGQGGAARVYLATEEELGHREVVLKVSADRGDEPSIQGRLDHAHIVPVLSVFRPAEGGLRGLCMPYREGMTLDRVLDRVRPGAGRRRAADLPASLVEPGEEPVSWDGFPAAGSYARGVAWVIARVAEALAHAHSRQIHHRDVKPANVLLTRLNGPQLLDFNLAHDRDAAEEAQAALRGGTLPYMAPEQLAAVGDPERWSQVGPRADLYSLGLLATELLTGRRPSTPDPALPLPALLGEMRALRAQGTPGVADRGRNIPHALRAILDRSLRPDPADRYPDASALAEDLRRFVEGRPLKTAQNPSPREVAGNWARRNRVLVALCLTGAVLAVAVPPLLRWVEGPNATAIQVGIGNRRADKKQWDLARQAYRQAAWLDPTNYVAQMGLGFVATEQGDYDEAIRAYGEAIRLAKAPGDDIGELYIGRAYARLLKVKAERDASERTAKPDDFRPDWETAYRSALADLDEAAARLLDVRQRQRLDGNRAAADLGLADMLITQDYPAGVKLFEDTARWVKATLRRWPDNLPLAEKAVELEARIKAIHHPASAN